MREADSMLRRWCPEEQTHQDAEDALCGWADHVHRLRLRRMLVCRVCQQGYFTRRAFLDHECHDAY